MRYLLSILGLVFSLSSFAQPPAPAPSTVPAPACGDPSIITYHDPILCGDPCAVVHAVVNGENPIMSGLVADDRYSGIIPIGFTFNYYGVPYTQCVIGSNGMVNFNLGLAGSYCPWPISAALLGNTSAFGSICGPWCDIHPGQGGFITYATSGTAPFRRFTATFCHTQMYSTSICPGEWTTTQIILYETCNLIDVHVGHKTICMAWNGGSAIIGVQNPAGTSATVAPGRDFMPPFTCTDEAWRFTPTGAGYTVGPTAYAPVPDAASPINWYSGPAGSPPIGSGPTLPCVPLGAAYRAEVAGCDFVSSSTVDVRADTGTTSTGRVILCAGTDAALPTLPGGGMWSGGPTTIATVNAAAGTVTGISPGVATYIYTYGEECTFVLTVEVLRCDCVDTCYWTVTGNNISGGNNIFGTLTNDDIRILTNNTDRAVVQAGGFMGVKQLSPTTTFDVDCVPTTAPSGLRFENLPVGSGNILVVDASGYVYVSPGIAALRASNTELMEQVNLLRQQVEEMKAQLGTMNMNVGGKGGNALSATPNPTDGQLKVSYTIVGIYSNAVVKITDVQGRLIVSKTVSGNTGSVSLTLPANIASGNLVIALVVDGETVATQKEVLLK